MCGKEARRSRVEGEDDEEEKEEEEDPRMAMADAESVWATRSICLQKTIA